MVEPIRFYFRNAVRSIDQAPLVRTVLQHLREDLHCTGTKEGCAEGDCGACTVVIGELVDGAVQMKAVNSCIQLLPTLDGKALFTVEDLQQASGVLHPVQQAMVDCHGSQCGFCTPGFVMSLWVQYLDRADDAAPLSRQQIDDTLSGNLCRCTGYRPIIDAAQRMLTLPPVHFDRAVIELALRELQRKTTFVYSANGAHFYAPRSLPQLIDLLAEHPHACLLAGSTDVGIWVTKQFRALGDIVYLGQVPGLKQINETPTHIEIGAGVSLDDAYAAASHNYPDELGELRQRFASRLVRNIGTLGGNVANGSPIGDSMPWLIALGARIVLNGRGGQRVLALEDFYLGYRKKDLRPGEFVESIRIPKRVSGLQFRTYKISKRFDQDISAVCAAFAFVLDGDTILNARVAFGGMAATPKRALVTESTLSGRTWNETTLRAAMATLPADFAPLSDVRASAEYRMTVAQNLLHRFWLETRAAAPLAKNALNVFARATS